MINDDYSNLHHYVRKEMCEIIDKFLKKVNSLDDGTYILEKSCVYAKILSYDLKKVKDCKIECHNKYADLQITISGMEGISIFDRKQCIELTSYDADSDITFLISKSGPCARVINTPGRFTLLFQNDAHRGMEECSTHKGTVRKIVFKLPIEQFNYS